MTDVVIIACIAALPPTVVSILAYLSGRKRGAAIDRLQISINGKLEQLIEAARVEERLRVAAALVVVAPPDVLPVVLPVVLPAVRKP